MVLWEVDGACLQGVLLSVVVGDVLFAFEEVGFDVFYEVVSPGGFFLVTEVGEECQAIAPFHLV